MWINARGLFERMAKMKMKPKRARNLFKRWLTWERELVEVHTQQHLLS
jgi:hypothetical protein